MENGWYLIKLNQSSEIEKHLPPSRCVYVEDGMVLVRNKYADEDPNRLWFQFKVTDKMIESPAYTIGKRYEFSDNGKFWFRDTYAGYNFLHPYSHSVSEEEAHYKFCREIEEPGIEISVKIGGEEIPLGPGLKDLIRAFINTAREIPGVKSSNPNGR
jgi:hypothetical protein